MRRMRMKCHREELPQPTSCPASLSCEGFLASADVDEVETTYWPLVIQPDQMWLPCRLPPEAEYDYNEVIGSRRT